MKCPRCQSQRCSKNGRKNGKQRFLCKDCNRQFVATYSQKGYSDEFKQICLKDYLQGKSAREIEREKKVHHTTVLLWVKQAETGRYKLKRPRKAAYSEISPKAIAVEAKRANEVGDKGVGTKPYPSPLEAQTVLRPSVQSLKQQEKSAAILNSALEIFTVHGYSAASMSRIAARAGVSKPTIYRYFGNKEALFTILIERILIRVQRNIFELTIRHNSPSSPAEVLRQLATAVLTKLSEEKSVFPLMRLVVGESGRFPQVARMFVAKVEKPIFKRLAAYFRFHPDIDTQEPMAMARIFIGALSHYLIVQHLLSGEDITPLQSERLVEELVSRMKE